MTPIKNILAYFPDAKRSGNGFTARCPSHDDQRASLSITKADDGKVLLKCHAGCDVTEIMAALGLSVSDLFPSKIRKVSPSLNGKSTTPKVTFQTSSAAIAKLALKYGIPSAVWTYHNAQAEPVGVVVRWNGSNGKIIRPVARHSDGWHIGAMPASRPLYCLPDLTEARRVVVCEGEKCAEAIKKLGLIPTTSAGGAKAAGKSDWRPLAGKEVWILPDNDPAGHKYAQSILEILAKLENPPLVRVVHLPNLPDGGDIVDWIDAHGDAAEAASMREEIETLAMAIDPYQLTSSKDLSFRPFPIDAMPEPIRSFVDAGALAIGCDPSYLALPLLTAIAAAIGNTHRLELKRGWSVPPIIWGAIVGESGTAKTPAFRLVMRPIRERQRKALEQHNEVVKQYEAKLAQWEKNMTNWKRVKNPTAVPPTKPEPPLCERFIVSDTTVEALAPILLTNPRGLLLARDEMAGWIGSFDRYAGKSKAGADSANWLSMFNAESIIVDRKTGIHRTIHIPQAAVCVSGGIQPAILKRALSLEHRESGLAARLLVTCPPRKAKRWTDSDIDPNAEAELVRLFDRLYELQPTFNEDGERRPIVVQLSGEAKAAWKAYYNVHAVEQADLTGDMAAAWSKLEEYAARLALVIHFTRWAVFDQTLTNANIMDAMSMNAGILLAKWFKHEARRVYAMMDESDTERDQRRLIDWISRKGATATPREVQQGCRWLKEPGEAETALEGLVKAGRGTWRDVPTTAKGGRPARVFVMSTPSTVHETPEMHEHSRVS